MCIPIAQGVPVLTADGVELGTAREILCPSPHPNGAPAAAEPLPIPGTDSTELWLRVAQADDPDLFVPFVEVAAVQPEGIKLLVTADEVATRGWDRVPAGLPLGRVPAT